MTSMNNILRRVPKVLASRSCRERNRKRDQAGWQSPLETEELAKKMLSLMPNYQLKALYRKTGGGKSDSREQMMEQLIRIVADHKNATRADTT
jgi:hypothetical protein